MDSAHFQHAPSRRPEADQPRAQGTLVGGLPWDAPAVATAPLVDHGRASSPASPPPPVASPPAESIRERVGHWVRRSPPLSISLSLHVLVLLFLALVVIREPQPKRLTLEMAFASEQAGTDAGGAVTIEPVPSDQTTESPDKTTPADDPQPEPVADTPPPPANVPPDPTGDEPAVIDLAAVPTKVSLQPEQPASETGAATEALLAPSVSGALEGRTATRKEALLVGAGGSGETEAAVGKALQWLARKQGRDGLWSLQGPYPDGSKQENKLAATAMALLAFQGAGHTTRDGEYVGAVSRGWKALLKAQAPEGLFDLGQMPDQHAMYAHAQATIAICELYGMTREGTLRPAAERAVAYAVAAQMPDGGWRYQPPRPNAENKGDMSVTGWFMMALKSAEMAGLDVPAETYASIGRFLDAVFISDAKGYGYQIIPGQKVVQVRPALTAEALLCRQYLGWRQDDPRLAAGVDVLFRELPLDFEYPHKNVYAWYYATQVCHHMGGGTWDRWNLGTREVLPANQVATGKEAGSWDPANDQWGHVGGRLFMTCLCTYMLEVYYRHLPLYANAGEG